MLVCVYYCAVGTRDRGCSRHPAFPAPSVWRGSTNLQTSGEIAPRDRARMFPRHCERSEAIHLTACGAMDCFVAIAPRNDGFRGLTTRDLSAVARRAKVEGGSSPAL